MSSSNYKLGQYVYSIDTLEEGVITKISYNDDGYMHVTFGEGIERDTRCITADSAKIISLLREQVCEYKEAFWREKRKNT